MKRKFQGILMMCVISLAVGGCYPDGPESVDEYDIVYTNHDDQFNFTGKRTYAMPDSVVKITGSATNGDPVEFLTPIYNDLVIERIKSNMASRGYTLIPSQALADLVLFPSAMEVTNISYYYDYWGYYYGWYYPPGYGGWYYPYPVVTTYTTGSLIMTITNNNNPNPENKDRAVWIGLVNGLLEGSDGNFGARINKTIDQAFEQSEYLHP